MDNGLDVLLGSPVQQPAATGLDVLLSATPSQQQQPVPVPPQQPVGVLDNLTGAASAFGHHVMNLPHGLAMLVENGMAKGSDALSNAVGYPNNPVNSYLQTTVASDNAAIQQREKDYQASTPNSPGSYAGATAGEIAPWLIGGPLNAFTNGVGKASAQAVSNIPYVGGKLAQAVAGGAAQGVVGGAATPVAGNDYWADKVGQLKTGALVGGLLSGGAQAAKGVYNSIKDAITPIVSPQSTAGASVLQASGTNPATVAANLGNAAELVPDSLPTTAQAAGTPEMVQLEKAFGNTPTGKSLLEARQLQNNNARISALESVAGNDSQLLAAKQARNDATSDWTNLTTGKLATGAPVDAGSVIQQLQSLKQSPLGVRPTIGSAADDIIQTIKSNALPSSNKEQVLVNPGILDSVRQNVKDYLAKYSPNGVVGTQQGVAFDPIRKSIVDAIEQNNPGYKDYLSNYAQYSKPINSMQAANTILDGLNGGHDSSGNPIISLTKYNSLLAKALRDNPGVSADAENTLNSVQQDLQRASISNSIKQSGSDTIYNANSGGVLNKLLYGNDFKGGVVPKVVGATAGSAIGSLVGHPLIGAGVGMTATSKLSGLAGQRYQSALADALLNPQTAQQALLKQTMPVSASAFANFLRNTPILSSIQ